ncbi:MAG: PEP-CTERM sorting domain-containing protein [Sedimentisphaerales bacterium]|nr:PEP-CTERM sorting domain-containing protein [Sedimentisphaerales bacterium]
MKRLTSVALAVLILLAVNSVLQAAIEYIEWNDGASHTIDTDQEFKRFKLDDITSPPNPGTHLNLISGGNIFILEMYNNATLSMTGGEVLDISARDNCSITISGGYASQVTTFQNANVTVTGGTLEYASVSDNSVVTFSGGTNNWFTYASRGGTIRLDGTGFAVDGQPLSQGDNVRDLGLTTGTITGTLADNSPFSTYFTLDNGNIIIVPEPLTLSLLALGGLIIRRKTNR